MNLRDSFLGLLAYLAPAPPPPPVRERALDAASYSGKRFRGASTPSIQADATGLSARLGPRARYAEFNQPLMASAKRAWVANLVGCGMRPSPNTGDPDLDARLMAAWEPWTDRADWRGQQSFYGIQKTLAEREFVDGESWLGLKVDADELRVDIFDRAQIPEITELAPGGGATIGGVKIDSGGRLTGYRVYQSYLPGVPNIINGVQLIMTPNNIRTAIGSPVLDSHIRTSVNNVIGVVTDAWPASNEARARLKLSSRAAPFFDDIESGIISGVSIGFSMGKTSQRMDGKQRVTVADEWQAREISIVPVGMDPAGRIRSQEAIMSEEQTVTQTEETRQETQDATIATRAAINVEIRSIAKTLGLPQSFIDQQIDLGAPIDQVRAAAIETLAKRSPNIQYATASVAGHDANDPTWRRQAILGALISRMTGEAPPEESREFVGLSLVEVGRDRLRSAGQSHLGSSGVLVERALTTSDFGALMGDAANRAMQLRYQAVPSALKKIARQITAPDFRTIHRIQLSSAPTLLPVNESGEFVHGALVDTEETMRLAKFGRIISLSSQVIINDDMGAFSNTTMLMGQAAAAFEAEQLAKLLESNPVMSDTYHVFDTTHHGNVAGTGAVISETTLTAARVALRTQTDQNGTLIAATPKYFVVPPQLETLAEKTISQVQATQTSNVNTFTFLQLLVESRLTDAKAYYLCADPNLIDGLTYAYLQGLEGPQLRTEIGFNTAGISYRIEEDFACAVTECRGLYKNPGA